ncbi:uncharacterized protein FMAN_09581 [Fusarium mangiferae]|uniref:Uncharacterized protein n=1 Tax=Fusarium mangiferae TaxID=192010 RepID=A0A1L7T5T1_FUSMA|nr:uncharacterized protein FMAN_09581 [Fusarium mangiferae]CVK91493.1 uncharacterized protein FMAN_09581 [Fusarium mangiferae]
MANTPDKAGYDAVSMSTVTNHDDLADSSTPGLNAELLIEEILRENTSLHASYRISTAAFPGRHFSLGVSDIWHKLNSAVTSANFEGKSCGSLNGFESILVEGDGLLPLTDLPTLLPPMTRVLFTQSLSIWVALSQTYLPRTADPMRGRLVALHHRLQGKQCIRCCILNAEQLVANYKPPRSCVLILTSLCGPGGYVFGWEGYCSNGALVLKRLFEDGI